MERPNKRPIERHLHLSIDLPPYGFAWVGKDLFDSLTLLMDQITDRLDELQLHVRELTNLEQSYARFGWSNR